MDIHLLMFCMLHEVLQCVSDIFYVSACCWTGVACSRPVKVGAEQPTVKNNKLARALLLILEHEQVSRGKSGAPTWNGKISVEHILPRNTSKAGAGWEQPDVSGWTATTKAAWLHRLGNLAMLNDSDNSSLGNCSFKSKVTKMKSFQASASWTIQSLLADYTDTEWCEADLQQRHQQLLDVFIKRWKVPAVPQVPSPGDMALTVHDITCLCTLYRPSGNS